MGKRYELDDLLAQRCDLTLEWRGNEFSFAYNPERYTDETRAMLNKIGGDSTASEEEQESYARRIMAMLLVDWDISSGGSPLPITPENVRRLPPTLLLAMVQRMLVSLRGEYATLGLTESAPPAGSGGDEGATAAPGEPLPALSAV